MRSSIIVTSLFFLAAACSKSPDRVRTENGKACTGDSDCKSGEDPTDNSGDDAAKISSPGFGPRRIWRLTPTQFNKTLTALFKKDYAVEAVFGEETRPSEGFGIDSEILKLDSTYASSIASILEEITKDNKELLAYASCKSYEAFTDACASEFIGNFGYKAFRRALTPDEKKRYASLYSAVKTGLGSAEAVGAVAEAMVRSPYTNFRFELGAKTTGERSLTGPELASALAFATTNAPPDDELRKLGESGELLKSDVYAAEVDRQMAKPEFNDFFVEFMMRFTGVSWLDNLKKQSAFDIYTNDVSRAMALEVKAYIKDNITRNKASFKSLLSDTKTTITPPLAKIYGLSEFRESKVIDVKSDERPGLINLPGVISANSPANHSGPVQRGIFILEKFLCFTPPPPPADTPTDLPEVDPNKGLKDRFADHEKNPSCAACHRFIDPPGFAYETFDAIGRFRDKDDYGAPVASSGTISLDKKDYEFGSSAELALGLPDSSEVQSCFVGHVFDYLLGRAHGKNDQMTLDAAKKSFTASSLDMRSAFRSIYLSDSFRYRKGE